MKSQRATTSYINNYTDYTTSDNLSSAEWMYNLYLFGLIGLIVFVIYLIFRTPSQSIFSTIAASVSTPAVT
jgi:hypothetical protein